MEKDDVWVLSNAVQKIVSEIKKIDDVFVYGNSSQIKLSIAPIEVFIRMSAKKITDEDKLIGEIKSKISNWKKEQAALLKTRN